MSVDGLGQLDSLTSTFSCCYHSQSTDIFADRIKVSPLFQDQVLILEVASCTLYVVCSDVFN